ncbi:MAG TPA: PAS domain S-box protein, partial [Vicinamibacterales bacterium]|nr:PAS domain S-box protein [Vicinamibacterales bacterium]
TAEELDDNVFEVANQLNFGAALLVDPNEKAHVATIDQRAGRKAKASAAYASACVYLTAGMALLDDSDWGSQYELMFSLWLERAECAFLTGDFDQAERLIAELLQHGTSKIDLAAAYHLKILLHVVKSENPQAVASALTCLRLFGIDLPAHPSWDEVQAEYEAFWRNLDGRPIEDLIDLPLMTDPELLAAMRLLSVLCDPAYVTDQNLLCLELCRAVNLGIRHGVSGAFAHACGYLGWPLATVFRRYPEGFRVAKLGYDLVEKHAFLAYRPKIQDATGIAAFWTQPMATSIDFVRASFRSALDTGDLTYACYAMYHTVTLLLLRNEPLDAVWREAEIARDFVRDSKFRDMEDTIVPQQRFIAMMQGRTASISTFNDEQFDEAAFEAQLLAGDRMPTMICWYWITKAKTRFLAGDHAEALAAVDKATALLWSSTGHFPLIDYYYYAALTVAALYDNAPAVEEPRWGELQELRDQLREWADVNRPSFGDKHALASAEIARLEGRELNAMRLYEEAIALAREHGFVQNEGLANELAARFYTARGFETIASAYLRNARGCYLRWGAFGKVRQLEQLHPHLRDAPAPTSSTIDAPVEQLDVGTVLKAAQAVSGEIVLDDLIKTLLRIAVEHAGAERGLLILFPDDEPRIAAEATTGRGQIEVTLRQTATSSAELPESVLHTVVRTRESVILDDASAQNPFSADQYICRTNARSVLCLPLVKQTRLIGVLYLENNLAPRVFTPARISVLELLESQAAISLENARLYNDLREREAKIRRLVDSNIIGIITWNLEGRILEANDAFLHMTGYSRDDLASGDLRWTALTPDEWKYTHEKGMVEIRAIGSHAPFEKEYFRKDGSRVPVLLGGAIIDERGDQGVSFVLDLTERKRSEAELRESERRYREAQMALAHANRVTTMGQLAASIAHEVNQPLAGVVANAEAGRRWLNRDVPDMEAAVRSFEWIINDGNRASEVIRRVRSLAKKTDIEKGPLDLNDLVREVIVLMQRELISHQVSLRMEFAPTLPIILGDRVQLQQVIINLVMNGFEAMQSVTDRRRELVIRSGQ